MGQEEFKDIEISLEEMNIMQIEIINGITKDRSRLKMTPFMSAFWDKLEEGIKNMPEGAVLELLHEFPG